MANSIAIPAGTPLAQLHVGANEGIASSVAVVLHDNEECLREGFARFKVTGAMFGDLDLDIPAGKKLFVSLTETGPNPSGCGGPGVCIASCTSRVTFEPKERARYLAELARSSGRCGTMVFEIQDGQKTLVTNLVPAKVCR